MVLTQLGEGAVLTQMGEGSGADSVGGGGGSNSRWRRVIGSSFQDSIGI